MTLLFCSNAYSQSTFTYPGDPNPPVRTEVFVATTETPRPDSLWMYKVHGTANMAFPLPKRMSSESERKRVHEWMLTIPEYAQAYAVYQSNPSVELYDIRDGLCGPFPVAKKQKVKVGAPYLTDEEIKSIEKWRDTNPIFSKNYQCHLAKWKRREKVYFVVSSLFSPNAVRDHAMRSQIRTQARQLRRDLNIPEPKE